MISRRVSLALTFSHNENSWLVDLTSFFYFSQGNILLLSSEEVHLKAIDFEYCSYNYRYGWILDNFYLHIPWWLQTLCMHMGHTSKEYTSPSMERCSLADMTNSCCRGGIPHKWHWGQGAAPPTHTHAHTHTKYGLSTIKAQTRNCIECRLNLIIILVCIFMKCILLQMYSYHSLCNNVFSKCGK